MSNYLNETKIFLNDNLSPDMRTIYFNARMLKKVGIIEDTWFSNAAVRMKLKSGGTIVVTHESELFEAFPQYGNFSFDTEFIDRIINDDLEKMDDLVGDYEEVTEFNS